MLIDWIKSEVQHWSPFSLHYVCIVTCNTLIINIINQCKQLQIYTMRTTYVYIIQSSLKVCIVFIK